MALCSLPSDESVCSCPLATWSDSLAVGWSSSNLSCELEAEADLSTGEKRGDLIGVAGRGISWGSRKNLTTKEYSAEPLSSKTISTERNRASTGAFCSSNKQRNVELEDKVGLTYALSSAIKARVRLGPSSFAYGMRSGSTNGDGGPCSLVTSPRRTCLSTVRACKYKA